MTSMMSSLTMPNTTINNRMPSTASALRFLIHLRLASNETGCIRLHTDIRMLFSNKSTELEGLDRRLLLAVADNNNNNNHNSNRNRLSLPPGILEGTINGEGSNRMHTIAEMPVGPKYSPVK
uniref:Atos-like C-terminal domain-containing protein n=1 Tax=Meloidogyne javanica TaxID=6303 RepID=A0A915LZJ3_MELJA